MNSSKKEISTVIVKSGKMFKGGKTIDFTDTQKKEITDIITRRTNYGQTEKSDLWCRTYRIAIIVSGKKKEDFENKNFEIIVIFDNYTEEVISVVNSESSTPQIVKIPLKNDEGWENPKELWATVIQSLQAIT